MPLREALGKGSNSIQLRRYNERLILKVLRRVREASKADLARTTGLTSAAVGTIVDRLVEVGLVVDAGKRYDGGRGQPATLQSIRASGAYAIGVRLDRWGMETVVTDFLGAVHGRIDHDIALPDPDEALGIVCNDILSLLRGLDPDQRSRIAGLGLAMPFNLEAWVVELGLPAGSFAAWRDVDFAGLLSRKLGLRVFNENDGTAAAIAELFHGVGQTESDFLYFFVGPAVGGGVVLGGDILRGSRGNAGDVAMIPVAPSRLVAPQVDRSDASRILLSRASTYALRRHLALGGREPEDRRALERTVAEGGPAITAWIEDCADALLAPIRGGAAILDVPTVIIDADIDGGLVAGLIERLTERLGATSPEARQPPQLLRGTFGSDAGAIGAATLPLFFSFQPRAEIITGTPGDRDFGRLSEPPDNNARDFRGTGETRLDA